MSDIKSEMIREALRKYRKIYPVTTASALVDCFTFDTDKIIFWFNTEDQSTRALIKNRKRRKNS
jgi:hypothetical protein